MIGSSRQVVGIFLGRIPGCVPFSQNVAKLQHCRCVSYRVRNRLRGWTREANRDWGIRDSVVQKLQRDALPDTTAYNLSKKTSVGKQDTNVYRAVEFAYMDDEMLKVAVKVIDVKGQQRTVNMPLLRKLEDECILRLQYFDIETVLHFAYEFYGMEYKASRYMQALIKILPKRWESLHLSHIHVLEILFHVGIYRNMGAQLSRTIQTFLTSNLHEYRGNELGLICHAFFACNAVIRNADLLHRITTQILSKLNSMEPYMVANVMKMLRHADYREPHFYMELANYLMLSMNEFNLNTVGNIALCYTKAGIYHEELFDSLAGAPCLENEPDFDCDCDLINMKHYGRLVWGLSKMQHYIPVHVLTHLELLVQHNGPKVLNFSNSSVYVIESLVGLALNGIYPQEVLNKVFSKAFLKMRQGESQE